MLRFLVGLSLMSAAAAIAQPATPAPANTPVPVEGSAAPAPVETPAGADVAEAPSAPQESEAPKMKKVCRTYEVVGSAIGKTVCTMRKVKPDKTST